MERILYNNVHRRTMYQIIDEEHTVINSVTQRTSNKEQANVSHLPVSIRPLSELLIQYAKDGPVPSLLLTSFVIPRCYYYPAAKNSLCRRFYTNTLSHALVLRTMILVLVKL